MYNKPNEYRDVYIERYGAKINYNKQNRHIYKYKDLKENASYFNNDTKTLQAIINDKAGTGVAFLKKEQLKEIIQDDRLKGFVFDLDKKIIETNKGKIHYSKTGIHLVPTLKDLNK